MLAQRRSSLFSRSPSSTTAARAANALSFQINLSSASLSSSVSVDPEVALSEARITPKALTRGPGLLLAKLVAHQTPALWELMANSATRFANSVDRFAKKNS